MHKSVRKALPWVVTIVAVIVLFSATQAQAASFTVRFGSGRPTRHYAPPTHRAYGPSYYPSPSYHRYPHTRYRTTYVHPRYSRHAPPPVYRSRTYRHSPPPPHTTVYRPSRRPSLLGRIIRIIR